MDVFALRFVKASLIYLIIGGLIGMDMVTDPQRAPQMTYAHTHLLLFGWVGMLIFGIAYHVLPRFRGKPLHSPTVANAQLYLSNLALIALVVFQTVQRVTPSAPQGLILGAQLAGGLAVVSFLMFFYNIWKTLA